MVGTRLGSGERCSQQHWALLGESRVHSCLGAWLATSGYSRAETCWLIRRLEPICSANTIDYFPPSLVLKLDYFNNWILVGPIWKYVNLGEINLIKFRLSRVSRQHNFNDLKTLKFQSLILIWRTKNILSIVWIFGGLSRWCKKRCIPTSEHHLDRISQ